jgi:hypothetical protein
MTAACWWLNARAGGWVTLVGTARDEPRPARSFCEIGVIGSIGVRSSSTRLGSTHAEAKERKPSADWADFTDFAEALGSESRLAQRPHRLHRGI